MDTTTFNTLARHFTSGQCRRSALRGFLTGTFAVFGSGADLSLEAKPGRKRRKNKNKRKPRILPPGARCSTNDPFARSCWKKQKRGLKIGCPPRGKCAPGYRCDVPVNDANTATYCSGGPDAVCGAPNADGDDTPPFCAVGHRCVLTSGSHTCQAEPEA